MHIDEWIDRPEPELPEPERYAMFFFMLHRLHAVDQLKWARWIIPFKLFCTYRGNRYQVTGCSRLGDIWLNKNLKDAAGYDLRVDVLECSEWSDKA